MVAPPSWTRWASCHSFRKPNFCEFWTLRRVRRTTLFCHGTRATRTAARGPKENRQHAVSIRPLRCLPQLTLCKLRRGVTEDREPSGARFPIQDEVAERAVHQLTVRIIGPALIVAAIASPQTDAGTRQGTRPIDVEAQAASNVHDRVVLSAQAGRPTDPARPRA